eukprot:m.251727 g.251727  ORF g.251727 m.251727 type:complete len:54 (+) comp15459_c0_seq1:1217-1378(+)
MICATNSSDCEVLWSVLFDGSLDGTVKRRFSKIHDMSIVIATEEPAQSKIVAQ